MQLMSSNAHVDGLIPHRGLTKPVHCAVDGGVVQDREFTQHPPVCYDVYSLTPRTEPALLLVLSSLVSAMLLPQQATAEKMTDHQTHKTSAWCCRC